MELFQISQYENFDPDPPPPIALKLNLSPDQKLLMDKISNQIRSNRFNTNDDDDVDDNNF